MTRSFADLLDLYHGRADLGDAGALLAGGRDDLPEPDRDPPADLDAALAGLQSGTCRTALRGHA